MPDLGSKQEQTRVKLLPPSATAHDIVSICLFKTSFHFLFPEEQTKVDDEILRQRMQQLYTPRREHLYADIGGDSSRNFGRQPNPTRVNTGQPPSRGNTSPSGFTPFPLNPPSIPAAPPSPSLSAAMIINEQATPTDQSAKKVPLFFRDEYSSFIVKGNFMTLGAKPQLVEEGEWIAHQGKCFIR